MNQLPLRMLAYVSRSKIPQDQLTDELVAIVTTAKRMNSQFEITGALFYLNGLFMQVIEGESNRIAQLMHNIERDERHDSLRVLINEPVVERGFADWNMDCFNLDPSEKIEQQTIIDITKDFKANLLPRGDAFVTFYRALFQKQEVA